MTTPNSEEEDPYKILGVARGATDSAIKSAYRIQARQNHPDMHAGKSEIEQNAFKQQFKRVQAAFEILSDPEERAYYDQHGISRKARAGKPMTAAEKMVAEVMQEIFNPLVGDVASTDYIGMISHKLMEKMKNARNELKGAEEVHRRMKKMERRFKRNGDTENPLAEFVRINIRAMEAQIDASKEKVKAIDDGMAELSNYTYDQEQMQIFLNNGAKVSFTYA